MGQVFLSHYDQMELWYVAIKYGSLAVKTAVVVALYKLNLYTGKVDGRENGFIYFHFIIMEQAWY